MSVEAPHQQNIDPAQVAGQQAESILGDPAGLEQMGAGTPAAGPTEYSGRHQAPEGPVNPDRFAVRASTRVAEIADKVSKGVQGFSERLAERRTLGQVASETTAKAVDTVTEKLTLGQRIARKIGSKVVSETKLLGKDIKENASENFATMKEIGREGAEKARGAWKARAESARTRREERKTNRENMRKERKFAKDYDDAHDENDSRDMLAEFEKNKAESAYAKDYDDAHKENASRDQKAQREVVKQQNRVERQRKIAVGKNIGTTLLKGAGLSVAAPVVLAGVGATKAARGVGKVSKAAAGTVRETAADKRVSYHASRAATLSEKAETKAASLSSKAAKHAAKVPVEQN
jgi:hypothetical protein